MRSVELENTVKRGGFAYQIHFLGDRLYNGSRMISDRRPVRLSVTLVYCGQTVGWIKMKLGTEVGLDHCVRRGPSPSPPLQKTRPNFRPMSVVAINGWIDQDATNWHGGRPQPRRRCVGGPSSPKGTRPQFSAHVCCGQTAEWIKIPLGTEV